MQECLLFQLGRTDELILDNVQGDFALNGLLTYTHPITGITTTLNTHTFGGLGSCRAQKVTSVSDGLHFTVDHRNHGMHHEQNRVTISRQLKLMCLQQNYHYHMV